MKEEFKIEERLLPRIFFIAFLACWIVFSIYMFKENPVFFTVTIVFAILFSSQH